MEAEIARLLNAHPKDRENIADLLTDYFSQHDDDLDTDSTDLEISDTEDEDEGNEELMPVQIERRMERVGVHVVDVVDSDGEVEMEKASQFK
jgi:hypothetical protein